MSYDVGNSNFWNKFFNDITGVNKTEQEQNTQEAEKNVKPSSEYSYHEETPDEEIVFDEQLEQFEAKQEETSPKGLEADKTLHDSVNVEEPVIANNFKYAVPDLMPEEVLKEEIPVEKYAVYPIEPEPSEKPSVEPSTEPTTEPSAAPSSEPELEPEPPILKYAVPPIETIEPSPEPEPIPANTTSPEPTPIDEPTMSPEPEPIPTPLPTTSARPIFRPRATSRGNGIDLTKWGGWQSSFFGRGKNVDLGNPWKINRVQTFVNVLSTATESFGKRLEGFMKDIFPGFRR